jgi:hypothetical protein
VPWCSVARVVPMVMVSVVIAAAVAEVVEVTKVTEVAKASTTTKVAKVTKVAKASTTTKASKASMTNETKIFPQFFTFHKINVPKNFELLSKDWVIYQILGLWKCGIELDNAQYSIDNYNEAIQFLDIESKLGYTRNKITMRAFSEKYDTPETLSRHFSRPIFGDYYNKIFGKLQYIGICKGDSTVISGSDVKSSLSSVQSSEKRVNVIES